MDQHSLKDLIHKHFKPIFEAYDKDGNSTLEKNQLRALLADNLGVTEADITQDQLDWHFDRIDENKDGHITFSEYVRDDLNQFAHFFGERIPNKKDRSEDDLIDIEEFRKLMEDTFKPLNIPITQEMVQWNFDKIDTDHSGRISFGEYVAFVKKYNQ